MIPKKEDAIRRQREEAWIGDAVLGLFVREWILTRAGRMDAELFALLTSNHFLSRLGQPTAVEAEIGRRYRSDGPMVARQWIEEKLLPVFERTLNRRQGRH